MVGMKPRAVREQGKCSPLPAPPALRSSEAESHYIASTNSSLTAKTGFELSILCLSLPSTPHSAQEEVWAPSRVLVYDLQPVPLAVLNVSGYSP